MDKFIKQFFEQLSEKFYSENKLSDMIWVLCAINFEFKKYFLSFFFTNIDYAKPFELYREYSKDDSRPDFVFKTENKNYLIEIKINDRKHHFEQYDKTFDNFDKAYITNYPINYEMKKDGENYCIKTWEDFINKCQANYTNENTIDSKIILSFICYLKNVCEYKTINHMNFKNLQSLASFNHLIGTLVRTSFDNFTLSPYERAKGFSTDYSGVYFEFAKENGKDIIYPWFGIHFNENELFISFDFEFQEDYCDILNNNDINLKQTKLSELPIKHDNYLQVKLKNEIFSNFENLTIDEQRNVLVAFFREVLNEIGKMIN